MTDATAIEAAVARPSMRFVPIKSVEQQVVLMLHPARELLVHQHAILVNALRAHLAEFGIVMRQGMVGAALTVSIGQDLGNTSLSASVWEALLPLAE